MQKLIELLGEPNENKTNSEYESWKWIKGKDQRGSDLIFLVETTDDANEYAYSYTADDDTEIYEFADLDDILVYAKEFLQYVTEITTETTIVNEI